MLEQPIPGVTNEDVERVVRRDFPAERFDEVMAVLREYGRESWQCGEDRVRLAVLKLADGDHGKLRRHMDEAKLDYRDVLAPAEHPEYELRVCAGGAPADGEVTRIIAEDWRQYEAWLRR